MVSNRGLQKEKKMLDVLVFACLRLEILTWIKTSNGTSSKSMRGHKKAILPENMWSLCFIKSSKFIVTQSI